MACIHECPMHMLLYHTCCSTWIWSFHQGSFPIFSAIWRVFGALIFLLEPNGKEGSIFLYSESQRFLAPRETREEWWPLLTVEAEVNGDSRRTNEKGPSFLVGLFGSLCRYKRILSCLGCCSRPSAKLAICTYDLYGPCVMFLMRADP